MHSRSQITVRVVISCWFSKISLPQGGAERSRAEPSGAEWEPSGASGAEQSSEVRAATDEHAREGDEHAREGGRDDRGVPYHAESTLSSAQVLKDVSDDCTPSAPSARTKMLQVLTIAIGIPTDMGAKQRQDQGTGRGTREEYRVDKATVHGMEGEPRRTYRT